MADYHSWVSTSLCASHAWTSSAISWYIRCSIPLQCTSFRLSTTLVVVGRSGQALQYCGRGQAESTRDPSFRPPPSPRIRIPQCLHRTGDACVQVLHECMPLLAGQEDSLALFAASRWQPTPPRLDKLQVVHLMHAFWECMQSQGFRNIPRERKILCMPKRS